MMRYDVCAENAHEGERVVAGGGVFSVLWAVFNTLYLLPFRCRFFPSTDVIRYSQLVIRPPGPR